MVKVELVLIDNNLGIFVNGQPMEDRYYDRWADYLPQELEDSILRYLKT